MKKCVVGLLVLLCIGPWGNSATFPYVVAPLGNSSIGEARLSYTWFIETVDEDGDYNPSIALDSSGTPHIAYGSYGYGLRYAHRVGGIWQKEVIEGGTHKGYADVSLVLDALDHPHIAYWEYMSSTLRYAWNDGTDWYTETIDTRGERTSMALDTEGRLHLAYFAGGELRYALRSGTTWYTETVDPLTGAWTQELSLDLDNFNRPHVSYVAIPLHLRYAYRDESGWHIEEISPTLAGRYNSLALDSAGRPHITSAAFCPQWGLCYAYKDDTGWHVEQVDGGWPADVGWGSSLVLDAEDRPYISYYDEKNDDLRFAYHTGTAWITETAADEIAVWETTSIALDAFGRPHIAYSGHWSTKYAFGLPISLTYHVYLPALFRSGGSKMAP
ncbi:MAG: hypothetical protein QXU79_00685 [Candidatus Micrarchaeaceae archaeon]